MSTLIDCPFCKDTDFDQVGLKTHLLGSLFFGPCAAFEQADTDEQWAEHVARQALAALTTKETEHG